MKNEHLDDLISGHVKVALAFSGGKESVVLAHMLAPYKEKLTLIWVNTGAMFPHMCQFVRSYSDTYNLVEVSSNQPNRLMAMGYPSYVVPIRYTNIGQANEKGYEDVKITDLHSCCAELRIKPIREYIYQTDITLIINGQREEDGFRTEEAMDLPGNKRIFHPLFKWLEKDVFDYINENDLVLPMQYPEGSSFECWSCTADISIERINFMQQHYPDLLELNRPKINLVYKAVYDELNKLEPGINKAMHI